MFGQDGGMKNKSAGASSNYKEALKHKKMKAIDIAVMVGPHEGSKQEEAGESPAEERLEQSALKKSPSRTDLTLHDDVNKSMSDSDELAPDVKQAVPHQDKYKKGAIDAKMPGETQLLGPHGHHVPEIDPNPVDPEAELAKKILNSEGESGESDGQVDSGRKLSGIHNRAKAKMRQIIHKSGPNNGG